MASSLYLLVGNMRSFYLYIKILFLWGIGIFGGNAYAYFQSLHQFPIRYITGFQFDSSGQVAYIQSPAFVGFQEQYKPYGVSGCSVGYPGFENLCLENKGGFGFELSDYSSYFEYKVFIPPGTKFFSLTGYFPQSVKYAATVRLGQPPTRTAYLTDQEYDAAKREQNLNADFGRLLAGEERIMVHDGGGAMNLSGIARMKNNPMKVGQWLYVRVLNGSEIHRLGAVYEIDRDIYKEWYETTLREGGFDSYGDPLADFVPHPPTVATATVRELQTSPNSPVTLLLDIKHPVDEITPGAEVNYYVGAAIPTRMFGMDGYSDVVFFLANANIDSSIPAALEWRLLYKSQPIESVAFERNRPLTKVEQSVQIPLFLTRDEIKLLQGKVRFGYTTRDGQFKILQVDWDPERVHH